MNIYDELCLVVDALDRERVPFAICGGLAVAIHGYVRATKDLDVIILAQDAQRALSAVRGAGFSIPALPMTFQRGTPRETVVQRVTKVAGQDHLILDLILVMNELADVWASREVLEWQGRRLAVVSRAGLARMKRMAGRTQDLLDLEKLGLGGPPDGE